MTQDQIRAHTPRHIIPEDNMRRLNDAEPVEASPERGWRGVILALCVAAVGALAIGITAETGWTKYNAEVLK